MLRSTLACGAIALLFVLPAAAEDGKKKNDKRRDEAPKVSLPAEQEMLAQATFAKIDADHDGRVTAAEAAVFFRGKNAKPVEIAPKLEDGPVPQVPLNAKQPDAYFQLSYDRNRDGAVTLDEYRHGWSQEMKAQQKMAKQNRNQGAFMHQRILNHMRNFNLIREYRGRRIP